MASLSNCHGDTADNGPDYILLQDVHGHPEAQGKLAALIIHGVRQWGARNLLIEGAFQGWSGRPEASSLGEFHDRMRRGEIAAPLIALRILSDASLTLHGIEHPASYRENLDLYQALRADRGSAERELKAIRLLGSGIDLSPRFSDSDLQLASLAVSLSMRPADFEKWKQQPIEPQSPALRRTLRQARRFYEVAHARSLAFVDAAERVAASSPKVMLTGGFHTEAMAEELRRLGRSYVVLAPRLTRRHSRQGYEERLDESVSALKLQDGP
jgi:hypothetical protein